MARDPADIATLQRELCERVALGETVHEVCEDIGIARSTPWRWAQDDAAFRDTYARARELQAHALAEQTMLIAAGNDSLSIAWRVGLEALADEVERADPASRQSLRSLLNSLENGLIQRNRLRVDTLKWFTSKIAPKLYGERTQHEVTGKDGGEMLVRVLRDEAQPS